MHKVIAELGVEGGGLTVCGRLTGDQWSFWQVGSSIDMDENDDECWKSWESEPVTDLALTLPDCWLLMYPVRIDEEFLPWFKEHYDARRAELDYSEGQQHGNHNHSRWLSVLSGEARDI